MKRTNCLLIGLILIAGCSGRGGDGDDKAAAWQADMDRPNRKVKLEALTFTDKCVETWGDLCDECEAREDARVDDCLDACSDLVMYDGSVACLDTCSDIGSTSFCDSECSEAQESCVERRYKFAPSLEPDSALLEACKAAVKRDKDCDEEYVGTDCDLYSRVERAEAVEVYRCVSRAECGTDASACFAKLPQRDFAKKVQALCPDEKLDKDIVPALDTEGNWARDEVARDLEECASFCGFGDFDRCVEGWLKGTTGWSLD